jgi:outer membrane protein TolC
MFVPGVVAAQSPSAMGERLSLDTAIRLALENNRQVQSAHLQVLKADEDIEVARTRRLPVFDIEVQASQLLTPVDFGFPADTRAPARFLRRTRRSASRGS